MGPVAARDLRAIGELADHLLAIALLAAAQATDATGRAAELPAPLAELHAAIRTECPATLEDERHDQRITRCLELYRAGRLPI
jgi:histidine ammonia-lyase